MYTLLVFLFVVLLVGIAIGLVLQQMLFARLRTQHPRAFEALYESGADIMAFPRFLWKRHYRGLADELFTRRAGFLRRYWVACFLFFLLVVVGLVVAISI